jgi:hypothetical protein
MAAPRPVIAVGAVVGVGESSGKPARLAAKIEILIFGPTTEAELFSQ